MRVSARLALIALAGGILAACKSGNNNAPICSLNDPAMLATSSWPKFHHDPANSGAIDNVRVSMTPTLRWVFATSPGERFQASPVLNTNNELIYIGSTTGTMYAVNAGDACMDGSTAGSLFTSFALTAQFGITSTALLATRDGQDAIFVGGDNGAFYGLYGTGAAQPTNWPFVAGGAISTSPNMNVTNGVVYAGSLAATFLGVCPNGVPDLNLPVGGVSSSPAIGADGTIYFGGDDGQLRAFDANTSFKWTFSTSAPVVDSAPVVEVDNGASVAIYLANVSGTVFKVTPSGTPFLPFDFSGQNGGPVGAIHTSPALAADHLYFGSDDGNLYAIDTDTGKIVWSVFTSNDGIASSPAVATTLACSGAPDDSECLVDTDCPEGQTCEPQRTVVVGSNDGNVYFVQDDSSNNPPRATFRIGVPVRSSPAIDKEGTVYVGADDGRLYAIGAPCGTTPTATPPEPASGL